MNLKLQRTFSCLLAIFLLTCPASATSSFPDVDENAAYAQAAEYLNEIGIMQGDSQGNFNPDKTVTRAQMAVILCRVLELTENLSTSAIFSDVPTDHWANAYIGKAAELGIVTGYSDGTFAPSNGVTYEQAVTMIIRAIGGGDIANQCGGYPEGFLIVAAANSLLDGVVAEKGVTFSRGNVAKVLFKYFVRTRKTL